MLIAGEIKEMPSVKFFLKHPVLLLYISKILKVFNILLDIFENPGHIGDEVYVDKSSSEEVDSLDQC